MAIRPAQAAYGAVLHDLVQRAYGVYIDRIGRRPWPMDDDYAERVRAGQVFVAEEDGAVVGLIVFVIESDHLLVENIAVEPDGRLRGSDAA